MLWKAVRAILLEEKAPFCLYEFPPPELYAKLNIGRAEFSKRQDWALECAAQLLPLVKPPLGYLIGTLKLDPDVLRDSTLL